MTRMEMPDLAGTEEISFRDDELFFSRTDKGGIILSGNSVFQRISIYSWDELLGKPHKVIRHPDMPRAVFWLLWDTIKQGLPIGAYVKNRAKDGRLYWVFAIVTPVEGGYLSVRLKPSSELFSAVKSEYQSLALAEKRENLDPAASAQFLLKRLAEIGFSDYPAFMAAALSHELGARDESLGRPRDGTIAFFDELVKAAGSLLQRAGVIADAYTQNEYVPLNFQIQAAQLGNDGATIGVISTSYNVISAEIKGNMTKFIASAEQVFRAINDGLFLVCTAKVQQEALAFFETEDGFGGDSKAREVQLLDQQRREYQEKATLGLQAIARQTEAFRQDCYEMSRLAAGLEVTRIMGKVECSRLTVIKDGLNELLDDLESFQKAVAGGLREIDQMNQRIQYNTDRLLSRAAS